LTNKSNLVNAKRLCELLMKVMEIYMRYGRTPTFEISLFLRTMFLAALKVAPKDQEALAAKVYLLIDLERFHDALALIEKAKLSADHDYEKVGLPCSHTTSIAYTDRHVRSSCQLLKMSIGAAIFAGVLLVPDRRLATGNTSTNTCL
jgi:hypothetical protein